MQGDSESRGEYLGEILFDIFLDVATGGLNSKADEILEYGDDVAKYQDELVEIDGDIGVLDEYKGKLAEVNGKQLPDTIQSYDLPEVKFEGNVINSEYILDLNNIPNMNKQEIISSVPNNWTCFENNGFVHIKYVMNSIRIRIDPPDKVTLYPHVHIYDSNRNLLDVEGKIVDKNSPNGHIPYKI